MDKFDDIANAQKELCKIINGCENLVVNCGIHIS
jgi:hypothetical protein